MSMIRCDLTRCELNLTGKCCSTNTKPCVKVPEQFIR